MEVAALAALSPGSALVPFRLERRSVGRTDVLLEVLYCGLCHSDLDPLRSRSPTNRFPWVPGHEVVGRVVETGRRVRRVKVGELAAVGWVTNACGTCEACRDGFVPACELAAVPKLGGYSTHVVVDERFVFRVPGGLAPAQVPPLLCSGSMLYVLLGGSGTMPGDRVAVVGTGGVAELASKLAEALGAEATSVTLDQLSALSRGADERRLAGRFDVVVRADVAPPDETTEERRFMSALLRGRGSLLLCDEPLRRPVLGLSIELDGVQKNLAATPCRLEHTQEVIDLCAAKGVTVQVEMVSFRDIEEAHARLERDPGTRLVADMSTLPGR